MKRIVIILILSLLVGCSVNNQTPQPEPNNEIILSFKNGNTITQDKQVLVKKNNSDKKYTFGKMFSLEKILEDGKTEEVPVRDNVSFDAQGYILEPQSTIEEEIDLRLIFPVLESGEYRLSKDFWNEEENVKITSTIDFKLESSETSVIEGNVIKVGDDSLLLYEGNIGLFSIPTPNNFEPILGDVLKIEYNMILESYPAQVQVINVEHITNDPSVIQLAFQLIMDDFNGADGRLFINPKEVYITITGLNTSQQEVLRYLLIDELKLDEVFFGTFEEIEKLGKYDNEMYSFPLGFYVRMVLNEQEDGNYIFELDMVSSGDGGHFMEGKAFKSHGEFEIAVTSFAIS